jgi:hypothetical protein
MMAVGIRAIDGTENNLQHAEWGSTDEQLLRKAPAEYADGFSTPAGADRPAARAVSNALAAETEERDGQRELSAFVYAWGQFLDHDIDLTSTLDPADPLPIPVPLGDPFFDPLGTGTQTIGFKRSNYDPDTGTGVGNPRQQINDITAFVDGSQVYGSDSELAASLRTLEGGRLKTSDGNLLPFDPEDGESFVAGDERVNENIELTSLHTLFVREHNRLADAFAAANPGWSDERIYQAARRIVIAELQAITYNEFIPALLGEGALPRYRGYNARVNPGIANEFSTAAFRLGHSLLGADVEFMDNRGQEVHEEVPLREAFNNPALVVETGIDPILKYLASDPAQELDNQVVDEVRNFLFGQPGAGGFDLASLNIQRGRDHGLADYNSTRVAYGLRPVTSFAQITRDVEVQRALEEMYGNVNNIDLWVGGLAEDHLRGSTLGPLFQRILVDQFQRLRDGDRFWYQRDLNSRELAQVTGTSLADVIRRNTTTTNLQDNVFFFHTSISGRVQIDLNRDGRITSRDPGLPGIAVQLLDLDGNVIATALTRRDGTYTFEEMDLDTYRVRLELPEYMRQITRDPRDIAITRSQEVVGVNFGVRLVPTWRNSTSPAAAAAEPAAATDEVLATSLESLADDALVL